MFDLTNTSLGRYQIREGLGKGGVGEVYIAFDSRLKREVALKVLQQPFRAEEACLSRFRQEAFLASALNHPNILTVYDIDVVSGKHIIATELVEGETLRKRLSHGPLGVEDTLAIAVQIADALIAAHKAGVIHRDIKPENIMIRVDRYLKLLDFGIAKLLGNSVDSLNTSQGMLLGTPRYMSPEQFSGEDVDTRTDIWSFGVVLYEMLTGRPPFEGSRISHLMRSILHSEPPQLSSNVPGLPPELESLVAGMLRKQPENRTTDLPSIAITLRRLLGNKEPAIAVTDDLKVGTPTVRMDSAVFKPTDVSSKRKSRARKPITRIAILPFINASMDQKAEYLSDGVTETIINNLSHLPQLRVMSRGSVFRFKGRQEDPATLGRELRVDAILTGKLSRVGSKLIIQTELVEVHDGFQIWGDRYSQKLTDIFKVQAQIAKQISDNLNVKLNPHQSKALSKRHTTSKEAYLSYLRGRFHWNKRTPEGLRLSINYFKEALEHDPEYGLAYAGLADVYAVVGNQHLMPTIEAYNKAKASAIRALEIDATLAEAHTTLGYVNAASDFNWSASEKEFLKAIKLNPGYATAHQWYSAVLRALGRTNEAIAEAIRAYELDPLSPIINSNVGMCLYCAKRYDEAVDLYRRILLDEPNFFWAHYGMALVYRELGKKANAIIELKEALRLTKDLGSEAVVVGDLAYTYGICGQANEAKRMIERLNEIAAIHYVSPYDFAIAHFGIGDTNTAFQWLERAYENRDEGLLWLKIDPVLKDVRHDSRFVDLLNRVGLG